LLLVKYAIIVLCGRVSSSYIKFAAIAEIDIRWSVAVYPKFTKKRCFRLFCTVLFAELSLNIDMRMDKLLEMA
jgi:hypothetical protein